jgi:hypothetical protein
VDPVPDPLLLRKSGNAWNRTRYLWVCNQEFWPLDHRGGLGELITAKIIMWLSLRISFRIKPLDDLGEGEESEVGEEDSV